MSPAPEDMGYDVIVIGAGTAGIACAGELLLQGLRPLLICETKEVAYNLRSTWVGGNRCVVQAPIISTAMGGGGWWIPLARALNARIGHLTSQLPFAVGQLGSPERHDLGTANLTAAALTDAVERFAPVPLGDQRDEFERVFRALLAIPWDRLLEMDDTLLTNWLADVGATEFVSFVLFALIGLINAMPPDVVAEHVTAFGGLGFLRAFVCGDVAFPDVYPDFREGVWIPMAQAVEARGGTIWRGRKVARVSTEGGELGAVTLEDGTEVRAPVVAIATGNPRIPALLDPVPPEIQRITEFEWGEHNLSSFYNFVVLRGEVLPKDFQHWFFAVGYDPQWVQSMWPGHHRAPWDTQPGKQTLVSATVLTSAMVEKVGGREAVYQRMREVQEFYFPGSIEATEEVKTVERTGGMHFSQILAGAKIQRRSESVKNLWYVGDGSVPIAGVYTEAAIGAGILGARAIAAEHSGHTTPQPVI